MDDEIQTFADGRPAAPPYRAEARDAARDRLLQAAAGRRSFRFPRITWQVAGAFGLTVALVGGVSLALSSGPGGSTATPGSVAASVLVAAEPQLTFPELDPKPGQYLLFESETMYTSEGDGGRYLYRTLRTFYRAVEGGGGLLRIEMREPKPWPGEPLPTAATNHTGGGGEWMKIDGHCPGASDDRRNDYAHVSTLPTDAAAMREHLYKGAEGDDAKAFTAFGDLLREAYLPAAQRAAVFEAAKTIPGVEVADGVEDSAGRKGTALGRLSPLGQLEQWIFDTQTHVMLGERSTVVDAAKAQAPVGAVMAHTAQLSVTVVDALPEAEGAMEDSSCEQAAQQSESPAPTSVSPTPTATITLTPDKPEATVSPTPGEVVITATKVPLPTPTPGDVEVTATPTRP